MAIVPVGTDGVSSGLPLGPYCPMKDPSSVKRPRTNKNFIYILCKTIQMLCIYMHTEILSFSFQNQRIIINVEH